jgi:hypothetical protein
VFAVAATYNGYQSIQAAGSINAGSGWGFYVASTQVINGSGAFIGPGVSCPAYGVTAAGFNPKVGGVQYTGAAGPYTCNWSGGFTVGATTYHNLEFAGGCLVGIS